MSPPALPAEGGRTNGRSPPAARNACQPDTDTSTVGDLLLGALFAAVNALIAALGAVLAAAMSVLPTLPTPPDVSGTWMAWLNWVVPVGPLLAILASFVLIWVSFLLVRIALKWARAL